MAILDAGLEQAWIKAFDAWERAERRYRGAEGTGNRRLIEYLRTDRERTSVELNAALRALNQA